MDSPSLLGQTISHYRILEMLGRGGMGIVYRAHDDQLDRDVALKVLPPGRIADESARKRFRKEALALAKMNHPNIETVHEFASQDGVDYLVSEFVEGVTLADWLTAHRLTTSEAARLVADLAGDRLATRLLGQKLLAEDRKSTRLNSSHSRASRMPSSA